VTTRAGADQPSTTGGQGDADDLLGQAQRLHGGRHVALQLGVAGEGHGQEVSALGEAVEVLLQAEGPALVGAQGLECGEAQQQAGIIGVDLHHAAQAAAAIDQDHTVRG
jgi:hypothetical protein